MAPPISKPTDPRLCLDNGWNNATDEPSEGWEPYCSHDCCVCLMPFGHQGSHFCGFTQPHSEHHSWYVAED